MQAKTWLLALALALTGTAQAADEPGVEYSADSSLETAESAMSGKLYFTPGMERREYSNDDQPTTMIVRRDKKVTWMLMPSEQMYMEMPIPEGGREDDVGSYQIEQTIVGPETVNDVETTKHKIVMTGADGSKMAGFSWVSKEGIVVKLDAISVIDGDKRRFKTELKNLEIGKQDPALFEIPEGYTSMSMGGLGGMMGVPAQRQHHTQPEPSDPPGTSHEEHAKKKRFSFKDAFKSITTGSVPQGEDEQEEHGDEHGEENENHH
jgi:outer membrane lipoprotein-sorting protein